MSEDLDKNEILGFSDRMLRAVVVPEWGKKKLYISEMSGKETDEYDLLITSRVVAGKLNVMSLKSEALIRFGISNAKRERLFKMEDQAALEEKSGEVLDRLFNIWREVNHLNPESAAKNSAGPSAERGTDSPSDLGSVSPVHNGK